MLDLEPGVLGSDMRIFSCNAFLAAGIFVLLTTHSGEARAGDLTLAIVEAGIQASEDAPFVPATYEFLPGEYLYFTFTISGYQTEKQGDAVRLHLEFDAALQD